MASSLALALCELLDVAIIGAGLIGLSVARACRERKLSVAVIDREIPSRGASIASAGIIPYRAPRRSGRSQLLSLSSSAYLRWSSERDRIGYRRCGELELALDEAEHRQLRQRLEEDLLDGQPMEPIDRVNELEPALRSVTAAFLLRETACVDARACVEELTKLLAERGVTFHSGAQLQGLVRSGDRIVAAKTSAGELRARHVVIAAGAWSGLLTDIVGHALPVRPLRGQIIVLKNITTPIRRVISAGSRYLVPRGADRVLIGSTSEEVGFDQRTTADGVAALLSFATSLCPSLREAELETAWAGLRPMTPDGLPIIDEVEPGLIVAAGHGRFGVALAPGTGEVVAQLAAAEAPAWLHDFRLDRFSRGMA